MDVKLLSGALGAEISGIDLKDSSKENYEKILNWNRSLRFALAVCTLKERFENEI